MHDLSETDHLSADFDDQIGRVLANTVASAWASSDLGNHILHQSIKCRTNNRYIRAK
jgi:hypothetical protein